MFFVTGLLSSIARDAPFPDRPGQYWMTTAPMAGRWSPLECVGCATTRSHSISQMRRARRVRCAARTASDASTSANIENILALQPDLVLTFSDFQVDIVADPIRRGIEVHAFNQRTVAGILGMIRTVEAMVGTPKRAEELVETQQPG
jgi:hypothetical protein